jgi:hypothetical protein
MPKPLILGQTLISDVKTMARGPSTFKQGDVTKVVKGVVAAGVEVMRVEVDTNGRIIVIAGKPSDATVAETSEDIKSLV